MNIDLDELERLAKAATPGPWNVGLYHIIDAENTISLGKAFNNGKGVENSEFMASFNPAVAQALINRLREAEKGLMAVADLINHSNGVAGLHLNGDIATWDELRTGGRFEGWLIDFDAAMEQGNE